MARFTCSKYPSLIVGGLRLRFSDGVIETDDKALIERLDALVKDGRFGVTRAEDSETVAPGGGDENSEDDSADAVAEASAKEPTKAELVAEAEALGIKVPSNATKAKVQEIITAATAEGDADSSDDDAPAGRVW